LSLLYPFIDIHYSFGAHPKWNTMDTMELMGSVENL